MTTTEDDDRLVVAAHPVVTADGDSDAAAAPPSGRRTIGAWLSYRWDEPGRRRVTIGWALFVASLVVYYILAGIPWSTN